MKGDVIIFVYIVFLLDFFSSHDTEQHSLSYEFEEHPCMLQRYMVYAYRPIVCD